MKIFILHIILLLTSLHTKSAEPSVAKCDSVTVRDSTEAPPTVCDFPDKDPTMIFQPIILYPNNATAYGKSAKVFVSGLIDTLGNVVSVRIVKSPDKLFNKEALRLAKQYKFNPITYGGIKKRVCVSWPINFVK